jgi:hypothetical protein
MTGAGIWVMDICKQRGMGTVNGVPLIAAQGDGLYWLNKNVILNNWAQNYPDGWTWYYYSVLSVAKAFLFSGIPLSTWLYGTGQMYDQPYTLATQPAAGQYYWHNPGDSEETDVFSTACASLACECGLISAVAPILNVILASYATVWITDPNNDHIGINPANGQLVNEIPNATYISTPVVNVTIPDPLPGVYDVELVGTGSGSYNLTTYATSEGNVYYPQSSVGTISENATQEYFSVTSSIIGPLTVLTTPGSPPVPISPPAPVGGDVVPIDKFALLGLLLVPYVPYVGLASVAIVAVTVATAIYIKRVKRRQDKQ